MTATSERINELIIKYLDQSLTAKELEEINRWRNASATNQLLFEKLTDTKSINKELEKLYSYDEDKNWEKIRNTLVVEHEVPVRKLVWKRFAVAASIALLISVGGYVAYKNKTDKTLATTGSPKVIQNDVAPGGNKAVLTLANGSQIVLDSANNGTLAQQGNAKVIKLQSGQLTYKQTISEPSNETGYNTISTPRGGQYQIELSDGTKVWLNAASSLRYPSSFNGKIRSVELTGEGYFEVAKNASQPFEVTANGVKVDVLGTHFNVNAYDDEAFISTTLLEGSVRVNKGAAGKIIKPGEQAQASNTASSVAIVPAADVNTDQIMAWKDGKFYFESADLKLVLRQFARWYDVDVIYEGNVSNEKFFGIMKRNITLANVLKSLQANGVKFRIEGNKLYVQSS